MSIALTIFTIVTGIASLAGAVSPLFDKPTRGYKRLLLGFCFVALIWSTYLVLNPGSNIEENVASNLAYYAAPSVRKDSSALMIQRGEFSFKGTGPYSIEFPQPFKDSPEVEIINRGGYDVTFLPRIDRKSPNQAIVRRDGYGGFPGEEFQKYRWVARGVPLEKK